MAVAGETATNTAAAAVALSLSLYTQSLGAHVHKDTASPVACSAAATVATNAIDPATG